MSGSEHRSTLAAEPHGGGPVRVRQRQVRLSDQQVDDLVDAYRAGASYRDLMDRFGIGETTVWSHLRRRGVPKRGSRGFTDKERSRLTTSYTIGVSISELATEFGVSYRLARATLLEEGVVLRTRGRASG